MIALDTNVLVRLVVADAEALDQSRRACDLVESTVDGGETIFLADVVLCEFVWVLRGAYRVDRAEIAATLSDLLATEHLIFESPAEVTRAVARYARGPADFADYLIGEISTAAGCAAVYTFDAKFTKSDGIEEPPG